MADFIDLIEDNQASCRNVAQRFNDKVKLIDQKIRELKTLKKQMLQEVAKCTCCTPETLDVNCPILA